MLTVQPHQELNKHQISLDTNTFENQEEFQIKHPKQQLKKPCVTSTKILIGLAVFLLLSIVSYQAYSIISPPKTETLTGQNHGKIIENASNTGKSSDGSSTTKSSPTSNKAIGVTPTVSKTVFGPPSIGKDSNKSGGDGEEPSDNNDGDKRKNLVNKNTKDGSGTSTEEDTESDQSGSGTNEKQGVSWPETEAKNTPMVGNTRD